MWSCHDLHLYSRFDLEVFSLSSPIHWDLSSNLCCCSFFYWYYLSHFSIWWPMQPLSHLSVLWTVKEETNTMRECLSTSRITTREYKVSDCISKASTSLMWHMWWVRPQCHHLLKASSVEQWQWRQRRQWQWWGSDNSKTVRFKGNNISRDDNITAVRLAIVTICVTGLQWDWRLIENI